MEEKAPLRFYYDLQSYSGLYYNYTLLEPTRYLPIYAAINDANCCMIISALFVIKVIAESSRKLVKIPSIFAPHIAVLNFCTTQACNNKLSDMMGVSL